MVAGWSTLGTALTVACFFPDIEMTPPTLGVAPPAEDKACAGACTDPSTNGTSPFVIAMAVGGADDVTVLIPAATILGVVEVGDTGEVGVVGCSVATGDDGVAKDDCC